MSSNKKSLKVKESDIVEAVKRDPTILEGILEIPDRKSVV